MERDLRELSLVLQVGRRPRRQVVYLYEVGAAAQLNCVAHSLASSDSPKLPGFEGGASSGGAGTDEDDEDGARAAHGGLGIPRSNID